MRSYYIYKTRTEYWGGGGGNSQQHKKNLWKYNGIYKKFNREFERKGTLPGNGAKSKKWKIEEVMKIEDHPRKFNI